MGNSWTCPDSTCNTKNKDSESKCKTCGHAQPPKQQNIEKFYSIKEKIGSGSFGTVKKAVRKSDSKLFAVKIIKKSKLPPGELAVIGEEVKILENVNHPNCVQLVNFYDNPSKMYMVMELLTGGELFQRILENQYMSEQESSSLTMQMLSAIQYLHSQNLVHRDLKPENIMFKTPAADSPIVVTDFGLAAKIGTQSDSLATACGTPGYVAPEVLKGDGYGRPVDVWSIGVILYILLCGHPPFYHENDRALYEIIKAGNYSFSSRLGWDSISDGAKDLVSRMLTVDPAERITPDEALQHPWICQHQSDRAFGADYNTRLKLMEARSKFRKAVRVIIALNRFQFDDRNFSVA